MRLLDRNDRSGSVIGCVRIGFIGRYTRCVAGCSSFVGHVHLQCDGRGNGRIGMDLPGAPREAGRFNRTRSFWYLGPPRKGANFSSPAPWANDAGAIAFSGKGWGVSRRERPEEGVLAGSRLQPKARQDPLDFRKLPDGDITIGAGDGQLTAVRAPSQPPNRPVVIRQ
jgi:hypothetical protein